MSRYDAIIVGSGPAGLEAALNLKIRDKRFLLFGRPELSRKVALAPKIDNYLGIPAVSGMEMAEAFHHHLDIMGISVVHETVSAVYPMGDFFAVASSQNTYEASAVILATGVAPGVLFPGEEKFLGRGVGYCATCDAPLYKGKTVAVIGYGNEAVRETNFIAGLAENTYYIAMDKSNLRLDESVIFVKGKIKEIVGDTRVNALKLEGQVIAVDGVFILRDTIAPVSLLPGIQVEDGFIVVDADMRSNLPGCFAAGDCTGKPHQYIRAAGQGLIAAHSAVAYIDLINQE